MSLLKVQIDGREVEVPSGTMVMEAANRLGIYVPHFCYHKKLSIAANCRMCLVQVDKAPKPMPACATPVTEGMKVWTHSPEAKKAQNGVMEFLLINHPLDCPICDQGGECQLQDLAVGYGISNSRYQEPKRVVLRKETGPLVAAEEMSRCIQCTRCVRFGQEVAGMMELGMAGRGEHSEIVSFVGRTIESELSGNMIDLCPVGALTSRPFRYTARPWELARRKSVSPHDGLGSNLIVQTSVGKVMRVLPLENEQLNECWLSDKDRFSYEGLNSPDRLLKPMLRQGGEWRDADWQTALEHASKALADVVKQHGPSSIGVLASPHSTLEELYLAQKLARGLGCENVDFRLRQSDFSARPQGAPWLGMKVTELGELDRVLVVGSFLRKDHPLIANRFRQAAKRGQRVNVLHVAYDDLYIKLENKLIVPPADLAGALAQIAKAAAQAKQQAEPEGFSGVPASEAAAAIAASLASGKNVGIFLGNTAQHHPQAALLHALAQELARLLGARFGFLGEAANSVGGYIAGCTPQPGKGLDAWSMLDASRKAYLLLNVEPELDCHDPQRAMRAMKAADTVIALSTYRSAAADYADVLLPVVPFTETAGTFVNAEGRMQGFNPVILPAGQARPAWKVLRVLGNLLGLAGFDYDTSEAVRDEACPADALQQRLSNAISGVDLSGAPGSSGTALQRIADVPIYFADPLVRRAPSLQNTPDAQLPRARVHPATLERLRIEPGRKVRVRQGDGEALVDVAADSGVPPGCIRLAAAHPSTARLGLMFGDITVEAA